jgi:hypothetical protein
MGNLDFAHDPGFSWYCLLLMFSGIAMLVISVVRNQATRRRVVLAIFGLGFFAYGFYLTFVFSSGHYLLFFQAFIVPVLLIFDTFRGRSSRRRQPQPPAAGGTRTMAAPSLQPMTDPGLPPMADPGLPPMADPGLPPMPPS